MSALNEAARISAKPMMPGSLGFRSSDDRSLTKRDCSPREIQIPWWFLKDYKRHIEEKVMLGKFRTQFEECPCYDRTSYKDLTFCVISFFEYQDYT